MDKNEKLLRIRSLLVDKKKEENVFSLKVDKLNEEMYAKEINPLMITFLSFTSSSEEKLERAIDKAGGKFNSRDHYFTREQLEKGSKLLDECIDMSEFFQVFDAVYVAPSELTDLYDFLGQVEEVIKDVEFAKKHGYLGSNLEQVSFRKYLKVVYDRRIDILKKPLEHLSHIKVHGIWEVMSSSRLPIDEQSYLFGHCTRSHTSCWPIISEGLKISKSLTIGGRCGKGIYFSNDINKCLQYTSFTNFDHTISFSMIFFAQVYTGRVRQINVDNPLLTASTEYD